MRVSDFINALAVHYFEESNGIDARFFFQDACSAFVSVAPPSLHPRTKVEGSSEKRCAIRNDDVVGNEWVSLSPSKTPLHTIPTTSPASSSSGLGSHTSTRNLHALRGHYWSRIAAIAYGVSLSDSLPSSVSDNPVWITEVGESCRDGEGNTSTKKSRKTPNGAIFLSPSQVEQHCCETLHNTFHGDFQRYQAHYRDLLLDTLTQKTHSTTVLEERSCASLRGEIPPPRSHVWRLTDAVGRILSSHSLSPLSEQAYVAEKGEWCRPLWNGRAEGDEDASSTLCGAPKKALQSHPSRSQMPEEEWERDPTSPCGGCIRRSAWFENDRGSPSMVRMGVAWNGEGSSGEGGSDGQQKKVVLSSARGSLPSGTANRSPLVGEEDVAGSTPSHLTSSSLKSRNKTALEQQFEWEKERDRAPYYSNAPDGVHAIGGWGTGKERDKENGTNRLLSPPPSWSMTLSPEQRSFLTRLRQTPLSPELLSSFVQEFSLVEGGPVFFHDVGPQMMVEYNGMQAGPYHKVIAVPLSLLTMRRCVAESRYQYDHCPSRFRHLPSSKDNDFVLTDSSNFVHFDSIASASPSITATPRREETNRVSTASLLASRHPFTAGALPDADLKSYDYQLLTLLDLERMVWHIAANCVFFNAPETLFRLTATKFALACSDIIQQYCMKQLYSSSIP